MKKETSVQCRLGQQNPKGQHEEETKSTCKTPNTTKQKIPTKMELETN